jgi:uncharacterized membrane protein
VVPIAIIGYILYSLFVTVDGWVTQNIEKWIGFSVPGLGILGLFVVITLLGFIGQTAIVRPFKNISGKLIRKIPILN